VVSNSEIADALDELGTLYEIDGANRFRVIAYHEGARVIRKHPVSVAKLAREGRAVEIDGVGKTLQDKIVALNETGEIPATAKLKAKYPAGLVDVTRLPGVGAKTARKLWEELGVSDLASLREAALAEKVRELPGLGPKTEQNILEALAKTGEAATTGGGKRLLLSDILPVVDELIAVLREHDSCVDASAAGSARRLADTCHDIDIVASSTDPLALAEHFAGNELFAKRNKPTADGVHCETHHGIGVDLRIVPPETFGNLLQHFTGSKAHNVELRERAVKQGLSISEHGIKNTETGEVERMATETEVYERLGYPYIPPELREGTGELDAALEGRLPELVGRDDIRGDLHMHTTLSDGRDTLEEMAEAGRKLGYSYVAITDHSASHGFGNNVTPKRLEERIEEIGALNEQYKSRGQRFRVLAGSEVNILPDGTLDYDDELLAQLDWVVASVHTSFKQDSDRMTKRMVAAIENPLVDCIGHPTGRLLLKRDPYQLDIETVIEAAARTGTFLEINGSPQRRDLTDQHARLAAEAGVLICLDTDAHGADSLGFMQYALATARRGWLTAGQVTNTRPWRSLNALRPRNR